MEIIDWTLYSTLPWSYTIWKTSAMEMYFLRLFLLLFKNWNYYPKKWQTTYICIGNHSVTLKNGYGELFLSILQGRRGTLCKELIKRYPGAIDPGPTAQKLLLCNSRTLLRFTWFQNIPSFPVWLLSHQFSKVRHDVGTTFSQHTHLSCNCVTITIHVIFPPNIPT